MFLALAALVLTAPVPKNPPADYFPTKVGAELVHDLGGRTSRMVVTKVEKKDGAIVVTADQTTPITTQRVEKGKVGKAEHGERKETVKFVVSGKGLFMAASGDQAFDPPVCLLKLPAVAGEKWEQTLRGRTAKSVTVGAEEVEVPAGKFRAVRVDTTPPDGGTMSTWFALAVGPVKHAREGEVQVLKSFTPGKD